jgi:hypothetical protein
LTKQFHNQEKRAVDYVAIFASKSADHVKFQAFFRHMFVDIGDRTYRHRILQEGKGLRVAKLKEFWDDFPNQGHIKALHLGDAYDLPGVPGGVTQVRERRVRDADDDFNSDIE